VHSKDPALEELQKRKEKCYHGNNLLSTFHPIQGAHEVAGQCLLMNLAWGKSPNFPQQNHNGTLLPGSSALPQTPDYHPSAQNPVVSALSRTRLQQFGTNCVCLSVLSNINLPQKPFSFQKPFVQCHCPETQESVCVGLGGGCVYAKFSHSCLNNVICVGVDSTFELYVKLRRIFLFLFLFCLHRSVL